LFVQQGFIVGRKFIVKEEIVVEKQSYFLITFLHVSCHGISWQNPKRTALSDWVLVIMDCMGRQNDSIQQVKCLITIAIIDVEENDDNKALVYVKGFKKREWLIYSIATWPLRSWMLIMKIDYEGRFFM